ncbi:hypothetical protein EGM51_17745 [Verrucomicrobia bacterium S94]|nr:hypothetical protein EGM51_17745 [Verrucomicrobia bacterium S94]
MKMISDLIFKPDVYSFLLPPAKTMNLKRMQIPIDTPELIEAAKQSFRFRGDLATGWSMVWKTALWARLKNGDHACKIRSSLLFPLDKAEKGR